MHASYERLAFVKSASSRSFFHHREVCEPQALCSAGHLRHFEAGNAPISIGASPAPPVGPAWLSQAHLALQQRPSWRPQLQAGTAIEHDADHVLKYALPAIHQDHRDIRFFTMQLRRSALQNSHANHTALHKGYHTHQGAPSKVGPSGRGADACRRPPLPCAGTPAAP